MPLSDIAVKNAKPAEKPFKMTDGDGLYLLVKPAGGKLWRYDYRFAGKRRTLPLGVYPEVSLKAARLGHLSARAQLREGIDPTAVKKLAKTTRKVAVANSFEAVAREWLAKQNHTEKTRAKAVWMFEALTFPYIGSRPVADVKAAELLEMLRKLESRGKLETAQRVKQQAGRVFRYAIQTGRAEVDPAAALTGALQTPKTKHRASITDPNQIGPLLRAIDGYTGSLITTCALKLAPLVFVRPGELRHAEWREFDLVTATWRIPAEKMKMRAVHIVPLSTQAVKVLRELQPLTGDGRYVFPGVVGRGRPMSEGTVLSALRRLGYKGDEMSGHGFRSMASTRLHEKGWAHDLIELQLAHSVRDKVSAAYNYAQHLEKRREMMQAWADYLDKLRASATVQ